ncbi:MAG TPA: hypothetical protein VKD26_12705 [Streptosporangiaceae bacterium]|nr:hypothetical protein [Streptosporangiaceae bacterium]
MEIPVALMLFAFGAILTFAVKVNAPALNLHIVGVILMAVAAAGIYFSRRGNAWVRKVVVLPRRRRRSSRGDEILEAIYPPYVQENPHAVERTVIEPVVEPGDTTVARVVAERLAKEK